MLECPQVAVFSEQGEVIGKTKGRKKRAAESEKDNETAPNKCPKGPKVKAKAKPAVDAGDVETAEPESRKGKNKGKKPEVEVPSLESLVDTVQPPGHVNSGTVYSNAYRKYQSLHGKENIDGAQKHAQMASAIFQAYGIVPQEYVGKFLEKPRSVRKTPTPQQQKPGGEVPEGAHEGENGTAGES